MSAITRTQGQSLTTRVVTQGQRGANPRLRSRSHNIVATASAVVVVPPPSTVSTAVTDYLEIASAGTGLLHAASGYYVQLRSQTGGRTYTSPTVTDSTGFYNITGVLPDDYEIWYSRSTTGPWTDSRLTKHVPVSRAWLDVVAYGADPTGVTDSTTAIQAALNDVPTGGGQVLFRGKFLISAPLVPKDGTALVGVGWPIPFTATTPAVLTGPSMTQPLIQRTGVSQNVTIEGLHLVGNNASATCKGIYAAEPYRWIIRDCHVRNCGGQAIHFAGGGGAGYASILENIVASGLLVRTGWAWGTGVVDLASTDMRLDFVEATASTNSDGWTGTAGNIVAITIRGSTCFITNCVAENAEYGWTFTDSLTGQNLVMNCRSDLNNGRGWEIAQPHNTFVQCMGYNNSRAANGAHHGFVIDGSNETLIGCRNYYDSTPAIGYGFVDFYNVNVGDYSDYNLYLGCRNSQPPVNGEYLFGGTGTKLWLGGSNTGMVATSSKAQSATAPDPGASGTIATAGIGVARVSPAAARAGVILAAGTQPGQEVWVVNEAAAANTITFAVAATSNVADGVTGVIAGLTAKKYVWDSVTARWYRAA